MSHSQLVDFIGRLHVDLDLREAFLSDRDRALAALDLTDTEREQLARLDKNAVVLIGRLSDFHRWARIQEHLSWVDADLRPDLIARVSRYMRSTPPKLLNRDEALGVCEFLEQEPAGSPPYLRDLARYERLQITVAWGLDQGGARVEADFEFPVSQILSALGQPGWPTSERSPSKMTFKKVPGIPAVIVRG